MNLLQSVRLGLLMFGGRAAPDSDGGGPAGTGEEQESAVNVKKLFFEKTNGNYGDGDAVNYTTFFGDDPALRVAGRDDVIRLDTGVMESDVRLVKSPNGRDLLVQLKDRESGLILNEIKVENHFVAGAGETVNPLERIEFSDGTVWVSDASSRQGEEKLFDVKEVGTRIPSTELITGSAGDDYLSGGGNSNGNDGEEQGDTFYGFGGNDVYDLSEDTGNDAVNESGGSGDMVRLQKGAGEIGVNIRRDGNRNLVVELLSGGVATDSLTVLEHFAKANSAIEMVVLDDGTFWDADDFNSLKIQGNSLGGNLFGMDGIADVFDSDNAAADTLYGGDGDDVYYLGDGTGVDTVKEYKAIPEDTRASVNRGASVNRAVGDDGDIIRTKEGVSLSDVRVRRVGDDLHVEILNGDAAPVDKLIIEKFHATGMTAAKVERIEVGNLWFDADELVGFNTGDAGAPELKKGTGEEHEEVYGTAGADIFDATGGNAWLWGRNGNDIYWLGEGGGANFTNWRSKWLFWPDNGDGNKGDVIRIKSDVDPSRVKAVRNINYFDSLEIRIYDDDGEFTGDRLVVSDYYKHATNKIERVEFANGVVWDQSYLDAIDGAPETNIIGTQASDNLNSGGGAQTLDGKGGDDTYWLGTDTGSDTVRDYTGNTAGDARDVVMIKSNVAVSKVSFRTGGSNLYINIVDDAGNETGNRLIIKNHNTARQNAKVEVVGFAGSDLWWTVDELVAAGTITVKRSLHRTLEGGENTDDVFDSDTAHSHILRGKGGNDVYFFGYGTGEDVIEEHRDGESGDLGDVIRLKMGISSTQVKLVRGGISPARNVTDVLLPASDGNDLHLVMHNVNGEETGDKLIVRHYYSDESAKIERIEFFDGTVWDEYDIELGTAIKDPTSGDDANVSGKAGVDDTFDGSAGGNDTLFGKSGNDTYFLGTDTGLDTINEHAGNTEGGDDLDVIKIKRGIAVSQVKVRKVGGDLYVELLNPGGTVENRLVVDGYYGDKAAAKIERIEFVDCGAWFNVEDFGAFGVDGVITPIVTSSTLGTAWGSGKREVFNPEGYVPTHSINNWVRGRGGGDLFFFGADMGGDIIVEADGISYYHNGRPGAGDANDVIRVDVGIGASQVELEVYGDFNGFTLHRLDEDGERTADKFHVENHFRFESARVERIEFADGVVWDLFDIAGKANLKKTGTVAADILYGRAGGYIDYFDADAGGDDKLRGGSGNDMYALGAGTGKDIIQEYKNNAGYGDFGDVIWIESGIDISRVKLSRPKDGGADGDDLLVTLMNEQGADSGDSLTVEKFYSFFDVDARVESIRAGDKVLLATQYQNMSDVWTVFEAGGITQEVFESRLDSFWQDLDSITTS